jgi:hypothetical protein
MRRSFLLLAGLAILSLLMLPFSITAYADDTENGSVQLDGGSLSVLINSVSYTGVTLNGSNQNSTGTINMSVTDARGTGLGWKIKLSSTVMTKSGVPARTIPQSGHYVTNVNLDNFVGSEPTNNVTSASWVDPIPATDGTNFTNLFNAADGTGMGNSTQTITTNLAIPANTYAGTYEAVITVSLETGP